MNPQTWPSIRRAGEYVPVTEDHSVTRVSVFDPASQGAITETPLVGDADASAERVIDPAATWRFRWRIVPLQPIVRLNDVHRESDTFLIDNPLGASSCKGLKSRPVWWLVTLMDPNPQFSSHYLVALAFLDLPPHIDERDVRIEQMKGGRSFPSPEGCAKLCWVKGLHGFSP
jgi:hypothetical protein